MNVAAPAEVVSMLPPDEVHPAGGVPCTSPPMDEENEDENLDFDEFEFGIVADLTVTLTARGLEEPRNCQD